MLVAGGACADGAGGLGACIDFAAPQLPPSRLGTTAGWGAVGFRGPVGAGLLL